MRGLLTTSSARFIQFGCSSKAESWMWTNGSPEINGWASERVVRPDALPKRAGHRFRHPTARDCAENLAVLKKEASVVGAAYDVRLL